MVLHFGRIELAEVSGLAYGTLGAMLQRNLVPTFKFGGKMRRTEFPSAASLRCRALPQLALCDILHRRANLVANGAKADVASASCQRAWGAIALDQ